MLGLALLSAAHAFCGFYVSGADVGPTNDASLAVLLREGTQTVLSIQNDVRVAAQDLALVVPVPVAVGPEDVRTLPPDLLLRVDHLTAPRLVAYWEADPCGREELTRRILEMVPLMTMSEAPVGDEAVVVEAAFDVDEYDVVILSASDSAALERWLRQNDYRVPEGASTALRPYVEQGWRFFVARVDLDALRFLRGRATPSPLQVRYDSPQLSLPLRPGLLNARGPQDLIVHVLARGTRYMAANYENAFIPTNIRLVEGAEEGFPAFYEALFQHTVAGRPRAVVTEYAWDAAACDPCPTPPLTPEELGLLGAELVGAPPGGWVLTRMHHRYTPETTGEDLVFVPAPPVAGGNGVPDPAGRLGGHEATPAGMNTFQARYVILHPWRGPAPCLRPRWGQWGGPPGGGWFPPEPAASALSAGLVEPGATPLVDLLAQDLPALGLVRSAPPPLEEAEPLIEERGCATAPAAAGGWLALLALLGRRRRA